MNQRKDVNRRIVLASRPKGVPVQENFHVEEQPVPQAGEGQIVTRNIYRTKHRGQVYTFDSILSLTNFSTTPSPGERVKAALC